jgi:type IV pilus assembly protein PilO
MANVLVERYLELSKSKQIAIWLGSLVFVIFIFWQYVYSGTLEEQSKLAEEKDNLETEITQEKRLAMNMPKIREEVKVLDVKLKFALQELPDRKEIPDLLSSISGLAKDAGLEVQLFRPKGEVTKDFYADVPVAVSVQGTYHQVATFFDEVGHLPRIVNIDQIAVKQPEINADAVDIKADCVATTFRYLDESERVKRTEEADTKTHKRGIKKSTSGSEE